MVEPALSKSIVKGLLLYSGARNVYRYMYNSIPRSFSTNYMSQLQFMIELCHSHGGLYSFNSTVSLVKSLIIDDN